MAMAAETLSRDGGFFLRLANFIFSMSARNLPLAESPLGELLVCVMVLCLPALVTGDRAETTGILLIGFLAMRVSC